MCPWSSRLRRARTTRLFSAAESIAPPCGPCCGGAEASGQMEAPAKLSFNLKSVDTEPTSANGGSPQTKDRKAFGNLRRSRSHSAKSARGLNRSCSMDSDHSGTQVLPRPKRSSSLDPPASRWALASVQDKSLFAGNEQVKGFFDILMSGDRGELMRVRSDPRCALGGSGSAGAGSCSRDNFEVADSSSNV